MTVTAGEIAAIMRMGIIGGIVFHVVRVNQNSGVGQWRSGLLGVAHILNFHSLVVGREHIFVWVIRKIFPHMIEVVQRFSKQSSNVSIVNRIDNLVALTARVHQTNRTQLGQVVRHGRRRYGDKLAQFVHAVFVVCQQIDELRTCGIAKRLKISTAPVSKSAVSVCAPIRAGVVGASINPGSLST